MNTQSHMTAPQTSNRTIHKNEANHCVWEREKTRERQTDRQTDRQTETRVILLNKHIHFKGHIGLTQNERISVKWYKTIKICVVYVQFSTNVDLKSLISFVNFQVASFLFHSRPVHSLMLSSHLSFCLPCLLSLFTVPCKIERGQWQQDNNSRNTPFNSRS